MEVFLFDILFVELGKEIIMGRIKRRLKKRFVVVFLIVLVVLIVSGCVGYYLYQKHQEDVRITLEKELVKKIKSHYSDVVSISKETELFETIEKLLLSSFIILLFDNSFPLNIFIYFVKYSCFGIVTFKEGFHTKIDIAVFNNLNAFHTAKSAVGL